MSVEKYNELAERNGWTYSVIDGKPYFMTDGKYAYPNENTTPEDKEMLAEIISEGSNELKKLILLCYDNGFKITGPCSGIKEFHNNTPIFLHFGLTAPKDITHSFYNELLSKFPNDLLLRDMGEFMRIDINYHLNGKALTKEEADEIFKEIRKKLELALNLEPSFTEDEQPKPKF